MQDARGVPLQTPQDGKVLTTVSAEDKDWLPKIREMVAVPPLADSGEYELIVKVKDELAVATTESRARFLVKGRDVAPSDTLVVRNFRFLRGENDEKPLQLAAYSPGDMVWARFDMTGYKLADHNQFDIEYGLTVLNADGSASIFGTAGGHLQTAELLSATLSTRRPQLEPGQGPAARRVYNRTHRTR